MYFVFRKRALTRLFFFFSPTPKKFEALGTEPALKVHFFCKEELIGRGEQHTAARSPVGFVWIRAFAARFVLPHDAA